MVKKRVYRAVCVNDVDLEAMREVFAGKLCVCGIDVAKVDFVASLMDADRRVAITVKWKHPADTRAVLALLDGLRAARLEVALESSGSYGDALRYHLEERGIPVFRVSTKRSHDAAELFDGVPSWHDAKSAALLARLHLDGISERWKLATPAARRLSATAKRHERHSEGLLRILNQLEGELARHWPELTEIVALEAVCLCALLAETGGPAAVAANPDRARELLRSGSRGSLQETAIARVIEAAESTLGVPPLEEEVAGIRELAQEAVALRQAMASSKRALRATTAADPGLRAVATVVGKTAAARLVAAAGDPGSYTSAAAYEKSLGLNLKERSSGKKKGRLTITKRGSPRARQLLFLTAMRLAQFNPVVRAWHLRKIQRDGGLRLKSMIAIMRKLARAVWHVTKHLEPFDATKLFDVGRLGEPVPA